MVKSSELCICVSANVAVTNTTIMMSVSPDLLPKVISCSTGPSGSVPTQLEPAVSLGVQPMWVSTVQTEPVQNGDQLTVRHVWLWHVVYKHIYSVHAQYINSMYTRTDYVKIHLACTHVCRSYLNKSSKMEDNSRKGSYEVHQLIHMRGLFRHS